MSIRRRVHSLDGCDTGPEQLQVGRLLDDPLDSSVAAGSEAGVQG